MSLMSEKMAAKWNEPPVFQPPRFANTYTTRPQAQRKPKMTKPKTPTLASTRALAKKKRCKIFVSPARVEVWKTGKSIVLLAMFNRTRSQALAMIHAALSVLPDVRGKK